MKYVVWEAIPILPGAPCQGGLLHAAAPATAGSRSAPGGLWSARPVPPSEQSAQIGLENAWPQGVPCLSRRLSPAPE